MSTLTIERLLHSLSEAGTLASEGSFSLSPQLAAEKLRDYRLPLPQAYILKILQFAVANGATEIRLEDGFGRIEMRCDGEELDPSDFDLLLAHLLTEDQKPENRKFRHLAAGLCGATAVQPTQLVFRYEGPGYGFRKSWSAQGWKRETFRSEAEQVQIRFMLTHPWKKTFSEAASQLMGKGSLDPETKLVGKLCSHMPAGLIVNGQFLPREHFGAPLNSRVKDEDLIADLYPRHYHLLESYLIAEETEHASLLWPLESHTRLVLPGPRASRCRCFLGVRAELSSLSEVVYVEDGVTLCTKSYYLPCPGFFAIYSCETMDKDLSGFQLRTDRVHEAWLAQQARRLRKALSDLSHREPEPMARRIGKALQRVDG